MISEHSTQFLIQYIFNTEKSQSNDIKVIFCVFIERSSSSSWNKITRKLRTKFGIIQTCVKLCFCLFFENSLSISIKHWRYFNLEKRTKYSGGYAVEIKVLITYHSFFPFLLIETLV